MINRGPEAAKGGETATFNRHEVLRDTVAFVGVVGALLLGREIRKTDETTVEESLRPLTTRLKSLETQMTGTQALLVTFTDNKMTVQSLSDYMNSVAALEVQDSKRIKALEAWANHKNQTVLFLGDK